MSKSSSFFVDVLSQAIIRRIEYLPIVAILVLSTMSACGGGPPPSQPPVDDQTFTDSVGNVWSLHGEYDPTDHTLATTATSEQGAANHSELRFFDSSNHQIGNTMINPTGGSFSSVAWLPNAVSAEFSFERNGHGGSVVFSNKKR